MKYFEKQVKKKYVFMGKVFKARDDEVALCNQKTVNREVIEHPGGACAIVVNKNDEIFLVKQYRYALSEMTFEIPAGKLEKNEKPLDCILRELIEEVGVKAKTINFLGEYYPSPGISNEKIYIFYTDDFETTKNNLDENEFLDVELIKISEVIEMIDSGKIKDMKTVVAVLKYITLKNK
ncbi:MAG: NUDIX hydrolase [Bacilli bacterium]